MQQMAYHKHDILVTLGIAKANSIVCGVQHVAPMWSALVPLQHHELSDCDLGPKT